MRLSTRQWTVLAAGPSAGVALFVATLFLMTRPAEAVPAFAEQTGQACAACHYGGFGPQLTPYGRTFKLEAYTYRGSDKINVPLSAMLMASYVHTHKDPPAKPAPHYALNDNTTLDQFSLFLAGGIGQHVGGFFQGTYDGVGRQPEWDNLDVRAMRHVLVGHNDMVVGVTLNNAPSVQDLWNTLPSWGFPFSSSDLVPAPAAGTILDGGLAQSVLGATAYLSWNGGLYAEAGAYWSPGHQFLGAMGVDEGAGRIHGAAPYVRVAYQKDLGTHNFEVGAFGFFPHIYPENDKSTGMTDNYSDYGIDASYAYSGDGKNIYVVNARYTHEKQHLAASNFVGDAAHADNKLNDIRFDASYYWHNVVGGTISAFNTWGSRDASLYADNRTLKPNSTGVMFEISATPWGNHPSRLGNRVNMRAGLQYIVYTRFDGAGSNYDGMGRDASANNAVRLYLWFTG